jgi:hypothetical protein
MRRVSFCPAAFSEIHAPTRLQNIDKSPLSPKRVTPTSCPPAAILVGRVNSLSRVA